MSTDTNLLSGNQFNEQAETYLKSEYGIKAMGLFKNGYNCSQAVFLAFADKYELSEEVALKISSSFGGGMGRLREVCGAVTGMFTTTGLVYGYTDPTDHGAKTEHYKKIQALATKFEEINKSIICRVLLGLDVKKDQHIPEIRTAEYYKKRPCAELVGIAAGIMAECLETKK